MPFRGSFVSSNPFYNTAIGNAAVGIVDNHYLKSIFCGDVSRTCNLNIK
jgi:hypothetical protein